MKTKITILSLCLVCGLLAATSCNNSSRSSEAALEVIMNRKSVRQYTDQKLSDAQIETLLKAAMAAPTGNNFQPWRFVVVTDQAIKEKMILSRWNEMYRQAAAVFVVCGENSVTFQRSADEEPQTYENELWYEDCAAATENLLLAAEALGLGAVWTACYPYDENYKAIAEILGLPEGVIPFSVVPVGYPAYDEPAKDKWKPENVHYNRW